MTTSNTPTGTTVPTRSQTVPGTGRDPLKTTRSPVPPPSRGTGRFRSDEDTPTNTHPVPEERERFRRLWLITPRTRPAWVEALRLLDDGNWHDITELHQVMHDAADLAPRTIANHLRTAGHRRWITRNGNRIRIRDRHLIEAALDATEGADR